MSHKKEYSGKDVIVANYTNIYDDLVKGVTITQICKKLGISRQSWYNMVNENVHFRNMVEQAEEDQRLEIKSSLVNKCQDRYIMREKVLPNGNIIQFEDFVPADFNAIKFYLLNKLPDEFKDKQEIQVKNTTIDVCIDGVDYQIIKEDEEKEIPLLEEEG